MRSIEVEGDDIDDAIAKALQALQVARDRVEIEILGAASRGLFGFGGRKARIRATVRAPLSAAGEAAAEPAVPRETSPAAVEGPARPERAARPPDGNATGAAANRAADFLRALLIQLGTDSRVAAGNDDEGAIVLSISGPETALIIGRRGQTLDAIEYLVNRIVVRDEDISAVPRFIVDAESYRSRRRQYLEELAARVCDKVRKTGRPVTLDPMTPRDRRIVHLVVQKHTGLVSRSQGEGFVRAMMIAPENRDRRPPTGAGGSAG